MAKAIEELSVKTIRALIIDEINKAKSGHPGMALGSAPILYTLFNKHLNVDPDDGESSATPRTRYGKAACDGCR